jgi:uncharacterized membrane protein YkvA (DUF1232 family)
MNSSIIMERSNDSTPESPISGADQKRLEEELFNRAKNVKREDEKVVMDELPGKMAGVLQSVNQRVPMVKNLLNKVKTLFAMLRDKNFAMAWSNKTMVIAGLLYFISPIDFLPDYIPLLGYIDDAFVVSIVMNALTSEIDRYQAYIAEKVQTARLN